MKKLLIIVFTLTAIWYLQGRFLASRSEEASVTTSLNLPGESSGINRILITDKDSHLGMQKKDSIWFLEGSKPLGDERAIPASVEKLVSMVDDVQLPIISQNVQKQSDLGIDDASAIKIEFFDNITSQAPVSSLLVSSRDKTLIRPQGSADVFQWSNQFSRLITVDLEDWLEATPSISPGPTSQ